MATNLEFDFEDEQFNAPPSAVLPWCQMINPVVRHGEIQPYGLAISEENKKAARVKLTDEWEEVEYEFSSGEVVKLHMTTTPRLLVLHRGPISLKERETGMTVGRLSDHYEDFLADRQRFKPFTRYLIFLVGENKELLHQEPLRMTLSGAAGASFGIAYGYRQGVKGEGFTHELEQAYAEFRGQPYMPKSALFHAHGIFCPFLDAVEKGSGSARALVATTVDFEHPTGSNITNYLIPSNSPTSQVLRQAFEEYQDFLQDAKDTSKERDEEGSFADNSSSYDYSFAKDLYSEPPY
ncbi:DUF5895 domain-containing protein [Geitlerinema sp. PCC 9228]|jgi:hypothetical protein|uniref:DUF5895 domain-containing protein n=1 Tax=Geitlerinema sp. PCC 9228 TaxID=111611 RepID=UPI0008F9C6A0|nr:DUF5895 domain-containing protein [Geitlerinema sp. PCC 9228]